MRMIPSVPPRPRTPLSLDEITRGVNEVVDSEISRRITFCSGVEKNTDSSVGCAFLTRAIVLLAHLQSGGRLLSLPVRKRRANGYQYRFGPVSSLFRPGS